MPLEQYTEVFSDIWQRFAKSKQVTQDFVILDGSLLHHQINDLIRNYNASEDDIVRHLAALLLSVWSLNPIVFYLSSHDVGGQLAKAWESRGKSAPTEEAIIFWKNRKEMDLCVLGRLAVESYISDVTGNNWDTALDLILRRVAETASVIYHYDSFIDEDNDPVYDPRPLQEYMDKWDGQAFIEALQLSTEKSVLEIGVGTGRLAVRVCDKCGRFTGIDISPKTIELAKENLRAFTNAKLLCGDFLTYPFPKTFDIVYSSLTFMHIKDKRAAIKKVADLLSRGGRFVLAIDKNQQTLLDCSSRKIEIYPDTPEEITSLLIGAGMTIENEFEVEFAVIFVARRYNL